MKHHRRFGGSGTGYLLIALVLVMSFVQGGCYPGDSLTPADTDIIVTLHRPGVNFAGYATFAMPDSVHHVGDSLGGASTAYDAQVLSRVAANMATAGFTRVSNPATADVHVVVLSSNSTWISGSCYPPYWGWWYPYPPGWGWCYPVTYTYQLGSVIIIMFERDAAPNEETIWNAGINGIISGSAADIASRLNVNIDQAFKQSPYLNH
jgi:hypothetical protein